MPSRYSKGPKILRVDLETSEDNYRREEEFRDWADLADYIKLCNDNGESVTIHRWSIIDG